MFIDTFIRVHVCGLSLKQIAERYANWLLGLEEGPRSRSRRLAEGVRQDWSVDRLLASEPLVGNHGCRVDVRLNASQLLVRFIHRDTRDGAVFWHTVSRAHPENGAVVLEHAVGRDAPKGQRLQPIASTPRVITDFLDESGVEVFPRELRSSLTTLHGDDVKGYVSHELLRLEREAPIIVVSCDRGGGPLLVDPETLALRLRSLGAVAVLATARSTFDFADALDTSGFGPEYKCFNGAVHMYGPTADLEQDHRLWLGESLLLFPEANRAQQLAGLIAGRIGVRNLPSGFFTLIEEHDREERRRLAERLSKRPSTPPLPTDSIRLREYMAAAEAEREQLRAELQRAITREKEYAHEWNAADDGRRSAERERDDAEGQLEQARAHAADLRESLEKLKRSRATIPPEAAGALGRILTGQHSPEDCLRMIGAAFPDRVVILDTALASAKKARDFLHTERLAELLGKLVTDYHQALSSGKGDTQASMIFGDSFAAKESESTMTNRRARTERTFRYADRDIVMWRHLKIGVKDSTAETIRIHFEWIAEELKIIVGWCGEHRYRVG